MREYPTFSNANDLRELKDRLAVVNDYRGEDIAQFDALSSRVNGIRKGTRIPASSADVQPTDRVGDFNWDTGYFYYLPTIGGWRRIASNTF